MKLTIKGRKGHVYTHEITKETVTIGRSSSNDFSVPIADFSRKHCTLRVKSGYFYIQDHGSKNGVSIDGKLVKPEEQNPIYPQNLVMIANFFQLILPGGKALRDDLATEEIVLVKPPR
jgi:pSer/pThr/pTyr-binding forkhead associated (FHA) protein